MSMRKELFVVPPAAHVYRRATQTQARTTTTPAPAHDTGTCTGIGTAPEVKERNYYDNITLQLADGAPNKSQPLPLPVVQPPSSDPPPAGATASRAEPDLLIYAPGPADPVSRDCQAPYARLKLHTITADQPHRTGIVEYRLINYLTLLANETNTPLPVIPPNPAARVHDCFPPELFATRAHFYVREMRCIGPAISTVMQIAQSNSSLCRYTLQDWLVGQAGIDYPSYTPSERFPGYIGVADLSLEPQREVWDSPLRHLFYQVVVAHCAFQCQRKQIRTRARSSIGHTQALYEFVFLADRLRSTSSDCRW